MFSSQNIGEYGCVGSHVVKEFLEKGVDLTEL